MHVHFVGFIGLLFCAFDTYLAHEAGTTGYENTTTHIKFRYGYIRFVTITALAKIHERARLVINRWWGCHIGWFSHFMEACDLYGVMAALSTHLCMQTLQILVCLDEKVFWLGWFIKWKLCEIKGSNQCFTISNFGFVEKIAQST